jgi:hypothetical protein
MARITLNHIPGKQIDHVEVYADGTYAGVVSGIVGRRCWWVLFDEPGGMTLAEAVRERLRVWRDRTSV